jgi:hypothetical protein
MRGLLRRSTGRSYFFLVTVAPGLSLLPIVWISFGKMRLTGECRAINLTKNSQLNVRHGDVERLIAQGYLQKLS